MKVKYRGFDIDVRREKSMTGISLLFYGVYSVREGWCLDDGFSYSDETVREYIKELKNTVDDFYLNPEDYQLYEDLPVDKKEKIRFGIEI
jgi:hypothetical protein